MSVYDLFIFYLFFNGSKEAFDPFLLSEENKIQIVMLLGR